MSWKSYKLTVLEWSQRSWKFCLHCVIASFSHLLQPFKGFILPCTEYCSNPGKFYFHRNCSVFIKSFVHLSLRLDVIALFLFYRYYVVKYSWDLTTFMSPSLRCPCHKRSTVSTHKFCADTSNFMLGSCCVFHFGAISVL